MLTSISIYIWGVGELPGGKSAWPLKGCDLMELLTWRLRVWQYLSQHFHRIQVTACALGDGEDSHKFGSRLRVSPLSVSRGNTLSVGESVCYVTEIYLQKEQAQSLSTTDVMGWSSYIRLSLEGLHILYSRGSLKTELKRSLQKLLRLWNQLWAPNLEHCCPSCYKFLMVLIYTVQEEHVANWGNQ